jgi:mRNA-degrading endonuclease RelE of RelBE toxin-antitoxin system
VAWEVEFTDEFEDWWNRLAETEQIKIDTAIRMLEEYGPDLSFPMSSRVHGSRHSHMRELRIQVHGKRSGCCTPSTQGARRRQVYDQHLKELGKQSKKEGSQHG